MVIGGFLAAARGEGHLGDVLGVEVEAAGDSTNCMATTPQTAAEMHAIVNAILALPRHLSRNLAHMSTIWAIHA